MLSVFCGSAILSSLGSDVDPSFAEVARPLGRLRNELELHFIEEEAGGGFDEAITRRPGLPSEAKRIEAEYPEILAEVTRLIDQANHSEPTVQNQIAMQQAFEGLYQRLRAQEKAENQLFAQGFGADVNSAANGQPALNLRLIFDF